MRSGYQLGAKKPAKKLEKKEKLHEGKQADEWAFFRVGCTFRYMSPVLPQIYDFRKFPSTARQQAKRDREREKLRERKKERERKREREKEREIDV